MTASTKALTDAQIIAKHSPSVRARARIELQIVNKLIETAAAKGYTLKIYEYEFEGEHDYDFKTAVFDLDDANVTVHDGSGARLGWMRLMFGNDGWDLISDYSVALTGFIDPVVELADSLADY